MTTSTSTIFRVAVDEIASEQSTRPVGAQARARLIHALEDFEAIEIDLLDRQLTPSFADECIGQLASALGLDEFKRRVKLKHVHESTKPLIKHVILTRCGSVRISSSDS